MHEKSKQGHKAFGGMRAVCSYHPAGGWTGSCHSKSADALKDATDHNNAEHGGQRYATTQWCGNPR